MLLQFFLIKQISIPTNVKKFKISANPKIPTNKAEIIVPAPKDAINVNTKKPLTNVINPPSAKHLPYSHTQSLVSFLIPKAATTNNSIKDIIANIIPTIIGIPRIPTGITPVKNRAPITIPRIVETIKGNIHTL